MRLVLFLVFIAVPLIELALIIKVGQVAGFWPTLSLIVGMAVLGTALLNRQGVAVLNRASEALAAGRPPVDAVVDGVFLFVAGLLLVTPGFVSDAIGLVLLIPPVRRAIARVALRELLKQGTVRTAAYTRTSSRSTSRPEPESGEPARERPGGGPVIETEFERLSEETIDPKRRRPSDRKG
jgi:UPF0716 protein FxsA